jgi:hypothetical protein
VQALILSLTRELASQTKRVMLAIDDFPRGVIQGDSLSSILFNIVIDMIVILIKRVKEEGHIVRVIPHLVDDGLSILQYANDTILFMKHDTDKAKNMKLL